MTRFGDFLRGLQRLDRGQDPDQDDAPPASPPLLPVLPPLTSVARRHPMGPARRTRAVLNARRVREAGQSASSRQPNVPEEPPSQDDQEVPVYRRLSLLDEYHGQDAEQGMDGEPNGQDRSGELDQVQDAEQDAGWIGQDVDRRVEADGLDRPADEPERQAQEQEEHHVPAREHGNDEANLLVLLPLEQQEDRDQAHNHDQVAFADSDDDGHDFLDMPIGRYGWHHFDDDDDDPPDLSSDSDGDNNDNYQHRHVSPARRNANLLLAALPMLMDAPPPLHMDSPPPEHREEIIPPWEMAFRHRNRVPEEIDLTADDSDDEPPAPVLPWANRRAGDGPPEVIEIDNGNDFVIENANAPTATSRKRRRAGADNPADKRPRVFDTASADSTNVSMENSETLERFKHAIKCSVCLDEVREMTSTVCGHIYCRECIQLAIRVNHKCPLCQRNLRMNNIHPLFF